MLNNIQIIYRVQSVYVQSIPNSVEINDWNAKRFWKDLEDFFRHHKLSNAISHRNNFNAKHSSLHYFLLYGLCVNILMEYDIEYVCRLDQIFHQNSWSRGGYHKIVA